MFMTGWLPPLQGPLDDLASDTSESNLGRESCFIHGKNRAHRMAICVMFRIGSVGMLVSVRRQA